MASLGHKLTRCPSVIGSLASLASEINPSLLAWKLQRSRMVSGLCEISLKTFWSNQKTNTIFQDIKGNHDFDLKATESVKKMKIWNEKMIDCIEMLVYDVMKYLPRILLTQIKGSPFSATDTAHNQNGRILDLSNDGLDNMIPLRTERKKCRERYVGFPFPVHFSICRSLNTNVKCISRDKFCD